MAADYEGYPPQLAYKNLEVQRAQESDSCTVSMAGAVPAQPFLDASGNRETKRYDQFGSRWSQERL